MKNIRYADGTPSREVEDDWETSGEEEMNKFFLGLKAKEKDKPSVIIVDIQDNINKILSLLSVCITALTTENNLCTQVASVLCNYIMRQLETIEEELRRL
jgi:hypothetical protein